MTQRKRGFSGKGIHRSCKRKKISNKALAATDREMRWLKKEEK
jgi:hypothetical protein